MLSKAKRRDLAEYGRLIKSLRKKTTNASATCRSTLASRSLPRCERAVGEHLPRHFIDLETARFEPLTAVLPDPYALKKVTLEQFAAAVLPTIARPQGQTGDRVRHMAARLRGLAQHYKSILLVCSVLDWPWIREAYLQQYASDADDDAVEETTIYQADPQTLTFLFGELPFITELYERARAELEDDENLSIDGIKELLIAARESYRADFKNRARKITPHLLRLCLKYIRNLSLIERRLTPDMYSIVTAAQQVAGDQYALHVTELMRDYRYESETPYATIKLGIDRARLPDGEIVDTVSRLPGPPLSWRGLELKRRPERRQAEDWQMRWNPFSQCSWPPEDDSIENFRAHVFDRAQSIMGRRLGTHRKIYNQHSRWRRHSRYAAPLVRG